ncbi:serine hydrolase domain-containing protein [Clostridium botulinum]|uniref:serine hydrolase domain-containing protein n=1 Tax=Clostridium botulinum TaxID=1491 RepID=UPI000772E8D2|nr:serine hydrolase domain-containing protein [Clostridium botulinum]
MKKINKYLIILSAFLSIILLSFETYALENNRNGINYLSSDENSKIEKFVEENMDKGKIPGLSVTIVKGDKTVYQKGFGYSDIELQKSVDSESLFEIGSNSKAFTALGILDLQKNGLIKFDDEVTKYIPWLKVKYKGKEVPITIEQLVHHTSGVPFNTIDKIPVSNEDNALYETVKTLIGIELDNEPGKSFQYATINYDVLGLIIQEVTGKSYENYIEENILKPMGLSNTYPYRNENVNEHMAKGYKVSFLRPHEYDAPIYRGNKPAGYIISNGEDMAKWLKIQMGTLSDLKFDKNLIEESHNANDRIAPLRDGSSYASGWLVYQKGSREISHAGNNPNYSSFILFRPEDKIGVAILSNTSSQYIPAITQGINEILQGRAYCNKDIKDLNKSVDKISILIIAISVLLIITTIFFMGKALKDIFEKERSLKKKRLKSILKLIFSLIFMLGISYSIYLIPYILYRGVSWEFIFVWLPKTTKIALYLVYVSIWIVYIYSIFTSFYKKRL